MRHAAAKTILASPQMVVLPKCAANVTVKPELRDIGLKEAGGERSLPMVPLFGEAKDSSEDGGDWGYFEQPLPWKYAHGVCFKDRGVFER